MASTLVCRICPLFLVALLASGAAQAAQVVVQISGLPEEIVSSVQAGLELQTYAGREVSAAQVRRIFRRSEAQLRRALEPYGYYNVQLTSRLDRDEEIYRAVFEVDPGERVIVQEADVRVLGEGREEPGVRAALEAFQPARGAPLIHAQYEQSKAQIESTLLSLGYLDTVAQRHRVEVSRRQNAARIDLEFSSGERYRFGEVGFTGGQFPDNILQRFVTWDESAYYSTDELLSLQQRLAQSEYFSVVAVEPDLENRSDGRVPVNVLLTPGKRNEYRASVFYGTDSGPGISLGYDRRWLNRRGHKLGVEAEFSQRLEAMAVTYRLPLAGHNNRSRNYGIRFRDEQTDTSESRTVRLTANESEDWHGFTRTIGMQFVTGDFEVGGERGNSSLLFPEFALTRTRADNRLFTRDGYSVSLALRAGAEALLSSTSFAQVRADAKWITGIGERQRFILRGALGATRVNEFSELPPELRFFAGGDRSVRGYDYQAIGPLNSLGEVTGGRNLAVASAEYEYYFLESWGVAAFVDTGNAFNGTRLDLLTGAGVGVRWRSPVGLVRVDAAKPVGDNTDRGLRFHVMIGPDL